MRSKRAKVGAGLLLLLIVGIVPVKAQKVEVDPALPDYERVSGVSGNLNAIGSDTLNNLMSLWAEAFQRVYPNVRIQIEGKGSSTAPPALIEGTAQLGPMSREMKSAEIDAFEKRFGYKPIQVRVAIDALALFVHKDNPIESMRLTEADGIFSSTRKRGGAALERWEALGVGGVLGNRAISVYGRNSASGTYGFFKQVVLDGGDFKPTVKEQPGSSSVVQGIATDVAGIGYSGIGYETSGVKALPLSRNGGQTYQPTAENALSGNYPLARFLYVYINVPPNEPADKLTAEFIKFVLSKQGQQSVVKDGYYPLPAIAYSQEVKKLDARR